MIPDMAWDLSTLESGVRPLLDHLKQPLTGPLAGKGAHELLAGGWRGSFSAWTGDHKEKVRVHKFRRSYNCNFICEHCYAAVHVREGNAFNFADTSAWMHTMESHRLGRMR